MATQTIPMGDGLHILNKGDRWFVLNVWTTIEGLTDWRQLANLESEEEARQWCEDFHKNREGISYREGW